MTPRTVAYAAPIRMEDLAAGGGLLDQVADYAAMQVEKRGLSCAAVMITMPNVYGLCWVIACSDAARLLRMSERFAPNADSWRDGRRCA